MPCYCITVLKLLLKSSYIGHYVFTFPLELVISEIEAVRSITSGGAQISRSHHGSFSQDNASRVTSGVAKLEYDCSNATFQIRWIVEAFISSLLVPWLDRYLRYSTCFVPSDTVSSWLLIVHIAILDITVCRGYSTCTFARSDHSDVRLSVLLNYFRHSSRI